MSLPNIPAIPNLPDISPENALSLVLVSIALEEIGLSHIINAEGEKIQAAIFSEGTNPTPYDLLAVNQSVEKTLRTVVKSQIVTEFKLQEVLEALTTLNGGSKTP
ncbi:hypothetical protein CEQ21_06585 [Niallia circulans]|uniref:Uncharacterized protein n=1 Tax=Niallia circulans TaxID=1397 RepID=A0A553SUA5_NIACI|nr:hypothetical protein [Niallia circulans]TRZ40564.1 hypothetical protein CEQ21_06585 [Niallia circulans]